MIKNPLNTPFLCALMLATLGSHIGVVAWIYRCMFDSDASLQFKHAWVEIWVTAFLFSFLISLALHPGKDKLIPYERPEPPQV